MSLELGPIPSSVVSVPTLVGNTLGARSGSATLDVVRTRDASDPLGPLRAALEESFYGRQGILSVWPEIEDRVVELAQSSNPQLRRYTLFFRMWRSNCEVESPGPLYQDFHALSDEAWEADPDAYVDPIAEIMIARVHSDGWLIRGQYRRAAAALAEALRWTRLAGGPEIHAGIVASLGIVLTLGGYVAEGLSCIARVASPTIDFCSHSFIGSGSSLRQERLVVVELADADEHTRNYPRAVAGLQLATSLLGPVEGPSRIMIYLALARCLAKVGQIDTAIEVFDDVDKLPAESERLLLMKYARTHVNVAASMGRPAEALELCSQSLNDELRQGHVGLYVELLLDGNAVARQLDEPHWILDHAQGVEFHNADGVPLAGTFAYQDLAWAYRRLGDTPNAKRCLRLAHQGRSRFTGKSGWAPDHPGAAPGVLLSARECHNRAMRAQSAERQSLERGIGSVAHDIRNQLQSLQLLSGVATWNHSEITTVRSIVTAIDNMLSDLLHDIEAEREIELTDVPLTTVVDAVLGRFQSNAAHKSIEVICSLTRPVLCRSDPNALDRIISNLVSNAIKYSPIGGSVEIRATTLGASFIDLHIIDSGPGIPADEMAELFRWGGTLSSVPTGSETQHGIGLFTAERLARLTGASIRPHARSGEQPSTMSVRLPLSRP